MKTFAFISVLFLLSCAKSKQSCDGAIKAKLVDLTGLDGCGWVLEKTDEKRLEPINLEGFDFDLENGKKVWVSYEESGGGSICMVGDIVKVTCIDERN